MNQRKLESGAHRAFAVDAARLQREAFAGLLRSPALASGDVDKALREVTKLATTLLDVRRASVWRFDAARTKIECLCLFDAERDVHESGAVLERASAPAYFDAAVQERVIAAHDARTDPRTHEFSTDYLVPLGITAMLDAPIVVRGELVGVLCCEHTETPREWSGPEELVAGTLADFVSMAMTARELAALQAARASQESIEALFEASPLGLVLTRITDQKVLLVNADAARIMEIADKSEVWGIDANVFWVNPVQRASLLESVRRDGVATGVEVELQSLKGRRFWGTISARVVDYEGERALLVGVLDITDKKLADEALKKSEETLRLILEAAPTPLVVTALDSAIVRYSNTRAAELFGTTLEAFVGKRAPDFYVNPDERQGFVDRLRNEGRVDAHATRLKTVDGRSFWALLSARTMMLGGERVFAVGFSDLTEQKKIEERLRDLASLDGLTGLFNRRHFHDLAENTLANGHRACAVMLDVDHFKAINDRHGHAIGDEALKTLTELCRKECRATDIVARYGGEEFAILLPEADEKIAMAVVERIRRAIAQTKIPAPLGAFSMTVSAGIAVRRENESLDVLMNRADEALYESKRAGRDRVSVG